MSQEIPPSDSVRIYYYAGTQHASGTFPPTDQDGSNGAWGQQTFNWVDYRPVLRASLVNLDRWVRLGQDPPPSRHPRIDDGTLVSPESIAQTITNIPGANFPAHLNRLCRLEFDSAISQAENLPARMGNDYPVLVPALDQDGNELGGIRLPDISVPLATHAGWNLRHPETGAPGRVIGTVGSSIPFPATREDREVSGDPRSSVAERYSSQAAYLEQVKTAAQSLLADGFLLTDDLATLMAHAAQRYQGLESRTTMPQPADN